MLHTGPRAVYLAVDRPGAEPWCLGVVGSRAAAVPNALRLALPDLRSLDLVEPALEDGAVRLGSITLRVSRLVDVRVPPLRVAVEGDLGDVDSLVARVGLGDGLTPYADDVLCGWLAVQVGADRLTRRGGRGRARVVRTDHAALGDPARLRAARRGAARSSRRTSGPWAPTTRSGARRPSPRSGSRRVAACSTGARLALGAHAVAA